jgi:hypothetical protein
MYEICGVFCLLFSSQLGKDLKEKALKALENEETPASAIARFVEKAVGQSLVQMLVSASRVCSPLLVRGIDSSGPVQQCLLLSW